MIWGWDAHEQKFAAAGRGAIRPIYVEGDTYSEIMGLYAAEEREQVREDYAMEESMTALSTENDGLNEDLG